jgi:hypothetical protein
MRATATEYNGGDNYESICDGNLKANAPDIISCRRVSIVAELHLSIGCHPTHNPPLTSLTLYIYMKKALMVIMMLLSMGQLRRCGTERTL